MKVDRSRILSVSTLLGAALLSGCGGEDSAAESERTIRTATELPAETTSDSVGGPGTYIGTTEFGATVTVDIPLESTDERVAQIEEYRTAANAPVLTYAEVVYDNTQGTEEQMTFEGIQVVTADGQTVTLPHIAKDGGVLEKFVLDGLNGARENEARAWYEGFYDQQSALPGAKQTALVATDAELPSIARVYANTDVFGGEIELVPESEWGG